MEFLYVKEILFQNFSEERYATDVIFQISNRPCGNVREIKYYFSGKHHLYGLKTEVSVLPNGFTISCRGHSPGSVADITIFRKLVLWHRFSTEKDESNLSSIEDN